MNKIRNCFDNYDDAERLDWLEYEALFVNGIPAKIEIWWDDDGLHYQMGGKNGAATSVRGAIDSARQRPIL